MHFSSSAHSFSKQSVECYLTYFRLKLIDHKLLDKCRTVIFSINRSNRRYLVLVIHIQKSLKVFSGNDKPNLSRVHLQNRRLHSKGRILAPLSRIILFLSIFSNFSYIIGGDKEMGCSHSSGSKY